MRSKHPSTCMINGGHGNQSKIKEKPGSAGPVNVVWHHLRVACYHENGYRQ